MRSRSLLWSFNYAIDGIVYALRTQRNMRIHVATATLVLIAALFFRVSRLEFLVLVLTVAFVIGTELVNTAVEATIDVATQTFDPIAKIAKDVAAGAVFVSAICAVVIGYVIFFGRLTSVTTTLLVRVRQTPAHITVVTLVLVAFAVLVAKALNREGGTWLRGGWPSGHTALAVSGAAAIAYTTGSAGAGVIGLFLAALVAHSRVESETHTIWQVIWGGTLGFLITTAVFQLFWV
ncbi:MAG: diacylglycerol kinase [Actinobacteria bacterium HGW-Actinobacteria-6]|jgi:diacylglycerol kinase (ATP)|nr:MAG: diacylglycerol kinase [Actinobacteria bacterium HGW-Actinobacteria-6]